MDADRRFAFGDQEGTLAYRHRMLCWLRDATLSPLSASRTYTISLESPNAPSSTCARPSSTRPLPALPFGVATEYVLIEPLQRGTHYRSEVWLAAPSAQSNGSPAAFAVFKFVIPSRGDIPTEDLNDNGIFEDDRGRIFLFPYDMVKGEAASYESLADFQGSTVPYFYGVHQVLMPWGEPAWMLALEWIPSPPGSLYALNIALEKGEETKYRDYELFMRLFQSALTTLQSAHKRKVNHVDVRAANILIDEADDQVVLIDWTSDHYVDPHARSALRYLDLQFLMVAFVDSGIEPQWSEIRRIYYEQLAPPRPDDSEDLDT
ncbi:hypothetical protein C8T65DRAFT_577765 [Cerioporus squamosus]|nr:hypothetical protein C8T65DRAFT_577765 [Cerioporus squamosus]